MLEDFKGGCGMKNVIVGLAGLIMIGLISAIYYYEDSNRVELPEPIIEKPINKPQRLQPVNIDDQIGYSLQNDELNITFNQGEDWITVPIDKDQLFNGEYTGNRQRLIEHSYVMTEERLAFLYLEVPNENESGKRLLVTTSVDQGQTWEDLVVIGPQHTLENAAAVEQPPPAIRFRKVDFLSGQFGYVIVTGERVVAQEGLYMYMTNDGGENWQLTNQPDVTRLIYDGGFVDEVTGFLSVAGITPVNPELHVTQDSGNTWDQANINVPTEYSEIFLIAEMPFKEGDHLEVLVNQGPNGDYKGGRVKGKFVSDDNGTTWDFVEEVEPGE